MNFRWRMGGGGGGEEMETCGVCLQLLCSDG